MRIFSTITLSCCLTLASAQTFVSGAILSNTTWTSDNSPYHVTDQLVVFDNVVLTVEPGVQVFVAAGKGIELRNGKLVAIGTAESPIRFASLSGLWNGFSVVGNINPFLDDPITRNQVQMEHCIGQGAWRFMDLDIAYHTPYNFINCTFSNNSIAIGNSGGSMVLGRYLMKDCTFLDNYRGLDQAYEYTIMDCVFRGNEEAVNGSGYVSGCTFIDNDMALAPYGPVVGCTFTGNTVAVDGYWNAVNDQFTDNTVMHNGTGIRMATFFNEVQFTGNRICHNTVWNIERTSGYSHTANLQGNCFCTDDAVEIENSIFHALDDLQRGLVNFQPFITTPECLGQPTDIREPRQLEWNAYPNPANEDLYIELPTTAMGGLLQLYDVTGRSVNSAVVHHTTMHWSVGDLPRGVYQVVLRMAENTTTRAIVLTH